MKTTLFYRFYKQKLAFFGLLIFCLISLCGIYAPLFTSGMPLLIVYKTKLYFPLFSHLFYKGYFSKSIDLFFNLLMFFLPLFFLIQFCLKKNLRKIAYLTTIFLFLFIFSFILKGAVKNPAHLPSEEWYHTSALLPNKTKALIVGQLLQKEKRNRDLISLLETKGYSYQRDTMDPKKKLWLQVQQNHVSLIVFPFIKLYHWEENAYGQQEINQILPWYHTTRLNRKDLVAGLIFGIRPCLMTGIASIALALLLGITFGTISGYFGKNIDLCCARFFEIWEAAPTFFILLLITSLVHSKSIFLVIFILGIFTWTRFAQFIRAEVLKQKALPYVTAAHNIGFSHFKIMTSEILPNALFSIITLIPFAMIGAISQEAGLSFLGLGEENSSSWGVLMDEARHAFPLESYLLWPPACLLTCMLVSIALIGDGIRNCLDPKFRIE